MGPIVRPLDGAAFQNWAKFPILYSFVSCHEAPDDDGHDTIPAPDYQPRHQNNLAEISSNLRVGFVDLPAADSDEEEKTWRFLGRGKEDCTVLNLDQVF